MAETLEAAGQPEVVRKSEPATRHTPELQSISGLAALVVVFAHRLSFYAPLQWYRRCGPSSIPRLQSRSSSCSAVLC